MISPVSVSDVTWLTGSARRPEWNPRLTSQQELGITVDGINRVSVHFLWSQNIKEQQGHHNEVRNRRHRSKHPVDQILVINKNLFICIYFISQNCDYGTHVKETPGDFLSPWWPFEDFPRYWSICLVKPVCSVHDLSGIWSFVVQPDTSWHRKRGRGLGAGLSLLQQVEDQRSGQIID